MAERFQNPLYETSATVHNPLFDGGALDDLYAPLTGAHALESYREAPSSGQWGVIPHGENDVGEYADLGYLDYTPNMER